MGLDRDLILGYDILLYVGHPSCAGVLSSLLNLKDVG